MEWIAWKEKTTGFFRKYRYAGLVLAVGLLLMLLPTGTQKNKTVQETIEPSRPVGTQESLTEILSQIKGVGRVRVMLTVDAGEKTLYQYDEDRKEGESGSVRMETVIITDGSRKESAVIQQILPETYRGALIVCDGADRAAVCLSVVEAVSKVTGLSSDKISVLKMK